MKLTPKFLDPTDITTLVNKSTGKHVIADGLSVIPVYKGKQYSIKDVVNKDGTVNVKKAKKIMEEVAEYFGGKKMQNRPENPVWHKDDLNTWLHTKKVAKNAWNMPVPEGYTKQDLMVAALGHDFGKILSGDGHAEVSYNLIKLIFPDATEKQLNAIRKHMDPIETIVDKLELATKKADMGILPTPEGHTRLYRVQRQGAEFDPHAAANGEAQREFAGMWFTDDSSKGAWYAHNGSKNRVPKGMKYSEWKKLHENDPAPVMELQYVDVPTDLLESYRASKILEGKNFDYEPEDFLIPNEIQRTMVELPWDRKKPYTESAREYEKFIKMLNSFKKGGSINYFQSGGIVEVENTVPVEEPIIPIFRHLPNEQVALDFDNDLTELFYSRQIKYGQLSEKAERKLLKKYNLDYTLLKETLDDLFTAGLGNALLADLLIANNSLKTYAQGGMIQKCSIGSAIKKFAGEGLENLGEKLAKEVGEDMALQATGTTKVIGKATTEHLRKVAKSTGDLRVKVLADFAEKCREKGIKLPEEFNQFVDAIFKVPAATKTDTKISRVGKEITANPEIIEWKGIVTERPTFEKTKYKTKTVHTGEFQNKLEFKRTVPKTQRELQEVSPKIDEAINSLRSMMEGDSFKLTPTMLDEIYAKTKSKVLNFSGNKELTGLLRRFFGEIEYPTLVERQLEKTYVHPITSDPNLERFYDASANNINWFKKVKTTALNYIQINPNYDVEKIKVLPLRIIPKDKELAVYHRISNYTSFLPKQIMTKRDAPYIKAYRLMVGK